MYKRPFILSYHREYMRHSHRIYT